MENAAVIKCGSVQFGEDKIVYFKKTFRHEFCFRFLSDKQFHIYSEEIRRYRNSEVQQIRCGDDTAGSFVGGDFCLRRRG